MPSSTLDPPRLRGADAPEGPLAIPSTPGRIARLVLASAGVVVLLVLVRVLPGMVGTTWSDVGAMLASVSPLALAGLTVLWCGTLVAHAVVQTSALPGLTMRDAVVVNMSSSAISSAVPFGGPASLALTWTMLRSWGFDRHQFSAYTLVSTVVSAVVRLLVPVVAALVLLASGRLPAQADRIAVVAVVALVAVAAVVGVVASPPLRRRLANAPHHHRLGRLARDVDVAIGRSLTVIGRRWRGLLGGWVAQLALQYLLLWACFAAAGAQVGPLLCLVAFGAGRLMSVLPLTPGGLGVNEAGVGALLVALGAQPGPTIAALLLFACYMVVLDVPLGALAMLAWRLRTARLVPVPAT